MPAELTRDEVLVDAVVAVLVASSWAVGSYNADSAFFVDPTWAVTGFAVATALLFLPRLHGNGPTRPRSP